LALRFAQKVIHGAGSSRIELARDVIQEQDRVRPASVTYAFELGDLQREREDALLAL
jgi:hypothetical protein